MNVQFIAEVASNHNQDFERCTRFIEVAHEIGCQGVKFQLFKVSELFAPEILGKSTVHRKRVAWELPEGFVSKLAQCAHGLGLRFSCTPFYLEAVALLQPYVDDYKIASYELLWRDLLAACARTGKPVVLSTGMATLAEVQSGVDVLVENGCRTITLLHCSSVYPVKPQNSNLAAIETLRTRIVAAPSCTLRFGWSDHSVSKAVIFRAVHKWRASMIEFHLDLEGRGVEFESGHCWLPQQMQGLIAEIKQGFLSDGDGVKQPVQAEHNERDWRADPQDGLRPLKRIREAWTKN
ncbi:MAG: N-acetylneuraminate synthase family protein [bacterium]